MSLSLILTSLSRQWHICCETNANNTLPLQHGSAISLQYSNRGKGQAKYDTEHNSLQEIPNLLTIVVQQVLHAFHARDYHKLRFEPRDQKQVKHHSVKEI